MLLIPNPSELLPLPRITLEAKTLGDSEAGNDAALDLLPLLPARSQADRYSLRDR